MKKLRYQSSTEMFFKEKISCSTQNSQCLRAESLHPGFHKNGNCCPRPKYDAHPLPSMKKSQFPSQMHCGACLPTQGLEAAGCMAAARCATVGLLFWRSLLLQCRGALCNTHKGQRTRPTCHPAFSSTFIYQEIKLGMLGQTPLSRSSLLWNLS